MCKHYKFSHKNFSIKCYFNNCSEKPHHNILKLFWKSYSADTEQEFTHWWKIFSVLFSPVEVFLSDLQAEHAIDDTCSWFYCQVNIRWARTWTFNNIWHLLDMYRSRLALIYRKSYSMQCNGLALRSRIESFFFSVETQSGKSQEQLVIWFLSWLNVLLTWIGFADFLVTIPPPYSCTQQLFCVFWFMAHKSFIMQLRGKACQPISVNNSWRKFPER